MTRNISLYLADILDNMNEAVLFVGDLSFEDFSKDRKTSYAVVRCLEIIGEAVKNVPEDIRNQCPDVPWSDMAGMREKCIHMYWGVRFGTVWTAVREEIPGIIPKIQSLYDEIRPDKP